MSMSRPEPKLRQVGRDHLRHCADLAASTPDLMRATATAVESLSDNDIKWADSSANDAAELMYAPIEAMTQGASLGPAARYIFHASIFTAALQADAAEFLLPMSGESAAIDLHEMMLIALRTGSYDFILHTPGNILDQFGQMLDQTYYRVLVRGYRIAALMQKLKDRPSAMEELDVTTQIEVNRADLRTLLPSARQECQGDESRSGTLDMFEEML